MLHKINFIPVFLIFFCVTSIVDAGASVQVKKKIVFEILVLSA